MTSRKKIASCHFFLIASNGAGLRAKKSAPACMSGRAARARCRIQMRPRPAIRVAGLRRCSNPRTDLCAHSMRAHGVRASSCTSARRGHATASAAYMASPFCRAQANSGGNPASGMRRISHKTSCASCRLRTPGNGRTRAPCSIAMRTRSESGSSQSHTDPRACAITAEQNSLASRHAAAPMYSPCPHDFGARLYGGSRTIKSKSA